MSRPGLERWPAPATGSSRGGVSCELFPAFGEPSPSIGHNIINPSYSTCITALCQFAVHIMPTHGLTYVRARAGPCLRSSQVVAGVPDRPGAGLGLGVAVRARHPQVRHRAAPRRRHRPVLLRRVRRQVHQPLRRRPQEDRFQVYVVCAGCFLLFISLENYSLANNANRETYSTNIMRALRYLTRPWFVMDVASTIPFHIMFRLVRGKSTGFGFLNLLRLWRLRRVSNLFARLEKDIRINYFCIRIIKLVCVSVLPATQIMHGGIISLARVVARLQTTQLANGNMMLNIMQVTLFALHSSACIFLWMAFHHTTKESTWIGSQVPQRLGWLHLRRLLGHHHARHRGLRRPARRQPRRDAPLRPLHALQHGAHIIHHRTHDQPRRPRRSHNLQDGKYCVPHSIQQAK
jgi:hypothetical protein